MGAIWNLFATWIHVNTLFVFAVSWYFSPLRWLSFHMGFIKDSTYCILGWPFLGMRLNKTFQQWLTNGIFSLYCIWCVRQKIETMLMSSILFKDLLVILPQLPSHVPRVSLHYSTTISIPVTKLHMELIWVSASLLSEHSSPRLYSKIMQCRNVLCPIEFGDALHCKWLCWSNHNSTHITRCLNQLHLTVYLLFSAVFLSTCF